MKIILSRKGFDSANGGIVSPIFDDGTIVSFPIPSDDEDTYDSLYCDVLQAGVWVVYDNTLYNTTPFVTSDNPVLVEGVGKAATGLFSNGLANPATCIFYPISPSIAVSLLRPFLLLSILFPFGFC